MTKRNFEKVVAGRYRQRGGDVVDVAAIPDEQKTYYTDYHWEDIDAPSTYTDEGDYRALDIESPYDLITYLGPLEDDETAAPSITTEQALAHLRAEGYDVDAMEEPVSWQLKLAREVVACTAVTDKKRKELLDGLYDDYRDISLALAAIGATEAKLKGEA